MGEVVVMFAVAVMGRMDVAVRIMMVMVGWSGGRSGD